MKHAVASLLTCALLMGCDAASNPFAEDDTTTTTTTDGTTTGDGTTTDTTGGGSVTSTSEITIPAAIAGNVTRVRFDATAGTLVVEGINLDNVPVSTTYTRKPALDQNGFIAFTSQDDALDRHFTAYAGEVGNVRAGVVSTPSPRNRSFMGAYFERDGAYDPPTVSSTSGLVTYAGTYIGLTNIGDPAGSDLISTTVTPTQLQPGQALITQGDTFLNADFADNSVEGNIFNRQLLDTNRVSVGNLPSLVLVVTSIDANGSFEGTVEYDNSDPLSGTTANTVVGSYAGIFGGVDSSEVAGAIDLTQFDGTGNPLGFETELESGVFLLTQCGAANASALCSQLP
jgi:hypothetical protein